MSYKVAHNVRALRSAGHLENVQPGLLPIKDTKVEDTFIDAAKQVGPEPKLNKKLKDERQVLSAQLP